MSITNYWSSAATRDLYTLFRKGFTMYQIAQALSQNHGKVSRVAVASKCNREGLRRDLQTTQVTSSNVGREDPSWVHPVTHTSASFIDLNSRQCKWPVGHGVGAKMMCCGAVKPLDKPYCTEHQNVARAPDQRPLRLRQPRI